MDKFTFSYPTKVYFGKGSAEQASEKEHGRMGKTVMLAYGGGSVKKHGIYDEIKTMLEQAEKRIVEFGGIMPNPTYGEGAGVLSYFPFLPVSGCPAGVFTGICVQLIVRRRMGSIWYG